MVVVFVKNITHNIARKKDVAQKFDLVTFEWEVFLT